MRAARRSSQLQPDHRVPAAPRPPARRDTTTKSQRLRPSAGWQVAQLQYPHSQTDTIEGDEKGQVTKDEATQGRAGQGRAGQGRARQGPAPAPPAPAPAVPAPQDIVGDGVVSWELVKAWTESSPNAKPVPRGKPGSTKHEQGGWILQDPTTGKLSVRRVGRGTRDGLGPIVGTRPAENASRRVVAWFHTHPNTNDEGYVSDPSPGDLAWQAAEAKVPGIILTHDGTKFIPFP